MCTRAILSALGNGKLACGNHANAIFQTFTFHFENPLNNLIYAEAIDGLSHYSFPETKILPLVNHKSPYVVGAALRFLRRRCYPEIFSILIGKILSPSWIVKSNAIDELEEMGDPQAIPHIEPCLRDKRKFVREAAAFAIHSLQSQVHD